MKLIILVFLVLLSSIIYPQYYGERTTEQNFEQSNLYFNSHYLNPYGLYNFKDIAAGFFDDPFLNLYINPASVPDLGDDELLVYLDFRGDRTEVSVINSYVMPYYYTTSYYRPYVDPRWFTITRAEPEPIFSIGILDYPIKDITKNFFIGGTYQFINREEKFYSIPYGIYYPNYYYDALGVRAEGLSSNVPIQDRYTGTDNLSTVGHLYSIFTGYKFNKNLSVGLSLDGVTHSRDGEYSNTYRDEYGQTNDYDWANSSGQKKNEGYHHLDLSGGVMYNINEKLSIGAKIGYLKGTADQDYLSTSGYYYTYNTPNISDEWNYNVRDYKNEQIWKHDGNSKYFSFNFSRLIDNNKEISGYYRYTNTDIDLTSSTNILDTSYYSSRYYSSYDTAYYSYMGQGYTSDIRYGVGDRKSYKHEVLLNLKWKLTDHTSVKVGVYYNSTDSKINSSEPVMAVRNSYYNYQNKYYPGAYSYELLEDKTLIWNYESSSWSLQIPIVFDFKLNENWGLMFGLNRIVNRWEIKDETTAFFNERRRNDNGEVKVENNFGERYTQPTELITDDYVKIMAGINVSLANSFRINLLLDPEFDKEFRFAQWWLSFSTKL